MRQRPNIRRTVAVTCIADIILIVCVLVIALYLINVRDRAFVSGEKALFTVLTVLALLCGVVSILFAWSLMDRDAELTALKSSLEEMNQLNNTIRAQRHDYLNHLQVVYGLMEMGQYDDANGYIEKVYGDIQKVSGVLKTAIPAVNAILQAKQQMCERRGIEAVIAVKARLDGLDIPDWELCRLLGNIIDNALNALVEKEGDKRLRIELFEDIRNIGFRISNNGPEIPKGLWKRIFEAGYTSGSHEGEGMGLAICHRIVSRYGGELTVYSDPQETSFTGILPRKA